MTHNANSTTPPTTSGENTSAKTPEDTEQQAYKINSIDRMLLVEKLVVLNLRIAATLRVLTQETELPKQIIDDMLKALSDTFDIHLNPRG